MRKTNYLVERVRSLLIWGSALVLFVSTISPSALAESACGTPLVSPTVASALVAKQYQTWRQTYVVSAGSNMVRVQRSAADNYDTVSEGIAYGMLFAVYSNDQSTFDGLWRYAQANVNQNGLMNWRIDADGTTSGFNGATDADEDMAAALVAADTVWGGYTTDALSQIGRVKKNEVEAGTNVLKPGDAWGGSSLLNPSYLTPSYYSVFAKYSSDASWNDVASASYRVLTAIATGTDSKSTGYIPDWSQADGSSVNGMSYNYGYDGSRAPLRLALAGNWECNTTATGLLQTLNKTNQSMKLGNLASSYALSGTATGTSDGTPLLAAATAAATASSDASLRANSWSTLVNAPSHDYFSDSMRLFGLFVAGGIMTNPLSLVRTTPAVAVTPVATTNVFGLSGSTGTATVGTQVKTTVTATAPSAVSGMLVDLEVYDANGTRVAQQFYENQNLGTIATPYTVSFTPTVAGPYSVRGGIFTANWAVNRTWNNAISAVTASAKVTTPDPVVAVSPALSTPVQATPSTTVTPPPAVVTPAQPLPSVPIQTAPRSVSIWWPSQRVQGIQPFKAVLDGASLTNYSLYWQVDGGTLNLMADSATDAPHKESWVDVSSWNWRSTQIYTINFVAKDDSGVIVQKSTDITVIH